MNDDRPAPEEYPLQPLAPGDRDAAAPRIPAIPAEPVHLCPNCKYNLTGLTHRRCPECGELFELRDARRAGSGELDDIAVDSKTVWRRRIVVWAGMGLTAASLVVPVCFADHPRRVGAFFAAFVGPVIALTLILRTALDLEWSTAWLIISVAAAAYATIALAVIF
jgi:hypothetical protein